MLTFLELQTQLNSVNLELRQAVLRDKGISELLRLQNAKMHLLQTMVEMQYAELESVKQKQDSEHLFKLFEQFLQDKKHDTNL